ncbi:MAG: type II toxin-antitoxin system RelE/ParE family toxin [Proteobacteria bacterium]|nr:type II toxin-antitoxin system RelE/ParE family toxin [Pseudomonadota bacterium]
MALVIYKPAADVEVAATFHQYEQDRRGLGVEFLNELLRIEGHLSLNPALYQRVEGDVRRANLRRFPYGLFYVIDGRTVSILACLNLHRRPPSFVELLAR